MAGFTLRVTSGAAAGTVVEVAGELVVGRRAEGPGGQLGDREISRRHARVYVEDDGALAIEDLGSTNGTFVEGDRLTEPRRLEPGDTIRMGRTTLVVQGSAEPAAAAEPPAESEPPEPAAAEPEPEPESEPPEAEEPAAAEPPPESEPEPPERPAVPPAPFAEPPFTEPITFPPPTGAPEPPPDAAAAPPDAGSPDAEPPDAAAAPPDAEPPGAGPPDAEPPDASVAEPSLDAAPPTADWAPPAGPPSAPPHPAPPGAPEPPAGAAPPGAPPRGGVPRLLVAIVVGVLALGGIAFAAIAVLGDDDDESESDLPVEGPPALVKAAKAAGCTAQDLPDEGRQHTTTTPRYRSNPPSSGPHNPVPAADAAYRRAPALGQLVHSLEHGRIVMWYRPSATEARDALMKVGDSDPRHMILTPNLTDMPYEAAATAWTHLLGCPKLNDDVPDAVRAFRDAYRDKGPETAP